MFPDFTLDGRTQCAFKSGTQVFILTTTTPIPGPPSTVAGPTGPAGPATTDASLLSAGTVADARLPVTAQAATLSATYVPQWKATTAYTAGQSVLSPNGDVVTAKAAHTSGASFTPVNWNVSYSKSGAVASPHQVGAAIHKLKAATGPVIISAVGDSTGAMVGSWLNGLVQQKLAGAFPNCTVIQRNFNDTNQYWDLFPTIIQAGAAGMRRYVSSGASTDRFFTVADSAATSITGDIDVRVKANIPNTAAATGYTLAGKYDTATNNRSWFIAVDVSNKLSLYWSTDGLSGTQVTKLSSVVIPTNLSGIPYWYRATMQASTGNVNFYTSSDGNAWTALGTQIAGAGATSIFDSTTATQFSGRGGISNSTGGAVEYHNLQVLSTIGGTVPVIDLETCLWNGYGSNGSTASCYDLAGNTVTINGTGQTGGMQGGQQLYFLNGCVSGTAISYANDSTRFPKLTPLPVDVCFINFSHNEVGSVAYRAPYKQLADAILAKWPDCGIIATIQNQRYSPTTNLTEHQIRGGQIASLAASQRYGMVNAWKILDATGTQQQYVNAADGIHPTIASTVTAGYSPGADVIRDGAWPLFSAWL